MNPTKRRWTTGDQIIGDKNTTHYFIGSPNHNGHGIEKWRLVWNLCKCVFGVSKRPSIDQMGMGIFIVCVYR